MGLVRGCFYVFRTDSSLAKKKVYVVETGPDQYRKFYQWPACQAFVRGKPYAFAGGATETEAKAKLHQGKKKRASAPSKGKPKKKAAPPAADIPTVGICSDAGTHGNPGPCEYQVTTLDGKLLVHKELGVHTNNYAELAGIGAMIQYAIDHGDTKLYTDSKIAMIWIASGKLGEKVHEKDALMAMIRKIQRLLKEHPNLELLKWHTKQWGEIPADFGRK